MKKVVMLIPCLMREHNRKANHKGLNYTKQHYSVDEVAINDQCFEEEDFIEGFKYIGHHKEGVGYVKMRNELLEYFYNSDFDYAIWLDARCVISKPVLNDFLTIIDALQKDKLNVDVIMSTMGVEISAERMLAKQMPDHLEKVRLTPAKGALYDGMNAFIMANFKKKYNITPYIDERCEPKKGTGEDRYYVYLLRHMFDVYLAPTVVVTAGTIDASVWMKDKDSYAQVPPKPYDVIGRWVKQAIDKLGTYKKGNVLTIELDRVDEYKELVKPYEPRKKKVSSALLKNNNN